MDEIVVEVADIVVEIYHQYHKKVKHDSILRMKKELSRNLNYCLTEKKIVLCNHC
jgi:hypothetical protein